MVYRLADKYIPTGQVMTNWGAWALAEYPIKCGHPVEDVTHILNFKKGYETCNNLKKVLLQWGETEKSDPNLVTAVLHGISLWLKGYTPKPPPLIPIPVAEALRKQTDIG